MKFGGGAIQSLSFNINRLTNIAVIMFTNQAEIRSTPSSWTPMDTNEDVKVVLLIQGSKEYTEVESLFKSGFPQATIVKIERIQNKELHIAYMALRQTIKARRGADSERTGLYHGTTKDTVPKINKSGFNRSSCGKNGTALGRGIYFAKEVSISAASTYSSPERGTGHKHIYMCKVVVGDFFRGKEGLNAPQKLGSQEIFDSTVDNEADPKIFVIFNDSQAYPEYLITFTV